MDFTKFPWHLCQRADHYIYFYMRELAYHSELLKKNILTEKYVTIQHKISSTGNPKVNCREMMHNHLYVDVYALIRLKNFIYAEFHRLWNERGNISARSFLCWIKTPVFYARYMLQPWKVVLFSFRSNSSKESNFYNGGNVQYGTWLHGSFPHGDQCLEHFLHWELVAF